MRFRSRTLLSPLHSCCRTSKQRAAGECVGRRYATAGYNIFLVAALLLQVLIGAVAAGAVTAGSGGTKGLLRMRSAKIARIHGMQVVPESLSNSETGDDGSAVSNVPSLAPKDKQSSAVAESSKHLAGKYEIRSVSGEPNYRSVNLTWEVEFVPSTDVTTAPPTATTGIIDAITNSSAEVEPPKAFQIFFCELQSFGPQRCRSKLVNQTQQLEPNGISDSNNHDNDAPVEQAKSSRQIRHYSVQIDNLRMSTKYSFHIRPQAKRRNMKITGRSEFFGNDIDDDAAATIKGVPLDGGQTIIIPTKGFAAQATKCLPQASEIEVETGPYFGGKIVVDGGNCGIKGDQNDPIDRYTMRINHKMCGSLVKPKTNTVETFITVQEKLGIYTHSTRRFVVVCSFQSGMQTVRASFTVPGSDGVAAAVENDPFEPDDRLGREQRHMRFVDKSALVLKDHNALLEPAPPAAHTQALSSDESVALVEEVTDVAKQNNNDDDNNEVPNSVALLEDIVPGVNERDIKHENEVLKLQEIDEETGEEIDAARTVPVNAARAAKYAKLVREQAEETNRSGALTAEQRYHLRSTTAAGRGFTSTLEQISSNASNIVITASLCVIVLGIFIFVVFREARRQRYIRSNIKMQQLQCSRASSPTSVGTEQSSLSKRTMPRTLQAQHAQGNM